MMKANDLGMGASLGGGEDMFQVPALGRTRIELPMEDLHGHEFSRLRITRLEKTTAAARLGFVQQFVATREEVSVHRYS